MPTHTPNAAGATGTLERDRVSPDRGWNTILWNDPVNLFDYVIATLVAKLGLAVEQAFACTQDANDLGKAPVLHGTRTEAEAAMVKLHTAGLHATVEHAR